MRTDNMICFTVSTGTPDCCRSRNLIAEPLCRTTATTAAAALLVVLLLEWHKQSVGLRRGVEGGGRLWCWVGWGRWSADWSVIEIVAEANDRSRRLRLLRAARPASSRWKRLCFFVVSSSGVTASSLCYISFCLTIRFSTSSRSLPTATTALTVDGECSSTCDG